MTIKLNTFLTFIAVALAGLSAFGFFIANEDDVYRILITCGSGISFFITLGGLLALASPSHGLTVNIRVVSGLFFTALMIEHIVFSFTGVRFPPYAIITGVLLVLYMLVCYLVIRALNRN